MTLSGSRMAVCAVIAAAALAGCARTTREHLFSGRQVTHVAAEGVGDPRQSSQEISVQGWVVSRARGRSLSLTFSNQSASSVPMSAVVDEYTAKTAEGRAVKLEVGDFLNYPDILRPGDERSITLLLPDDVPVRHMTQVIANLNQRRVVIALHAIGPKEPPAWRVGTPAGIVVSERANTVRIDMAQSPVRPAPQVLEPVGPVAPRSEAPVGTVPVVVAFHQQLGSTLRADVSWNDAEPHITLATGEQQLFYVVPGQHELHVISRLPFIVETRARVPVVISATEPVRVDLAANAKLTGVELRVRVFRGERLVVDQTFAPTSSHG